MPFTIVRNDITKLRVDAIVNAANTSLLMGGGVCGAIFIAAGEEKLQAACDALAPIRTGEAVVTPGFDLPAKYIVHTAGPVYMDGKHGEEALLRSCYSSSLALAAEHGCESIAFPLISSGIYGYPKDEALRVATSAILDFILGRDSDDPDMSVILVVFDRESFVLSGSLLGGVRSYIDENYVDDRLAADGRLGVDRSVGEADLCSLGDYRPSISAAPLSAAREASYGAPSRSVERLSLTDLIGNLDESFSRSLLRLIDATGKKDSEVYRRANVDRRLFSKIRSNAHYAPSKSTALAFAVALELTLEQTSDLLARAGFALSHSRVADVIVEYFIKMRVYDIFEINEVLFSYDQPLLGG